MLSPKLISSKILQWIILATILAAYLIFAQFTLKVSENATIDNLRQEALGDANIQANELRSELQKFLLVPVILRENPDVTEALTVGSSASIDKLNIKLQSLTKQTDATYIYAINKSGQTIASSNYDHKDSFVGHDYQYRPYFLRAMQDGQSQYYAKGQTTGRAGLFLGGRISNNKNEPIGVIVVKVEFSGISTRWRDPVSTSFVVNQDGIILFSGEKDLNFTTIKELSQDKQAEILEARQFGTDPLSPSNLNLIANPFPTNARGQKTVMSRVFISELEWSLHRLSPLNTAMTTSRYRAQLIILLVGISLLSLILIYRRRLQKEREKAALTELLKSEVASQTKELSETNRKLEYEITQRENVNLRFRAAREELAQANRLGSVGAITASVAHELNQPVSAIRTFAENALTFLERGNTHQTSTNLSTIVSLTERIGSISTELRRYARRGTQAITAVELDDVFDGVQLLMGEPLRAKGINFIINNDLSEYPSVNAGRVRLEQVFVNLIQNAIDALEGRDNPKIEITILKSAPMMEILVADNGTGIDDELAAQIYTPFITTKQHGMGMGLGIAKDILTEFGGSIELFDSPLGGAAFLIKLQPYE